MQSVERLRRRLGSRAALAGLIALPFIVYSNAYDHAYQLDDAYTVVSNPSIRSLANIPSFFVDPATYTSIREQADYRPLLQTTYALNYRMGGYNTWWWHFTQVLLHAIVAIGIAALCRRIMQLFGDPHPDRIALFAGALFAIHPANAGVVDYFNARSSLLTAVFLLPALLSYMKHADRADYGRPQWAAAGFYTLALFTKVEAVGLLGAFWAFDLWQRARETSGIGLWAAFRASFDRRTIRRIAPALVITAIYFLMRRHVMAPFPFESSRHAPDVGAYEYFLTQLTAWWYYVMRWLAPVNLVADYLAYPVFRAWYEPAVLFAAGGWIVVGALLIALRRRAPYLLFLAIAALALLSPTSSVAPLAEMVNEHRPYLPIGILTLGAIIPAGLLLRRWPRGRSGVALTAGIGLLCVSLSAMTFQRNQVFATSESYWRDVLDKAPSSRAHLNYGLALMSRNEMGGALRHYRESLELAPYWYLTHLNLGVAYQHLGQLDSARIHFDRAVEYDQYSGFALTWRAEFLLTQREYAGARDDFLRTMPISLQRYRNVKGLATAYAGLGDVPQALERTKELVSLDSAAALRDIAAIAQPFFQGGAQRSAGIQYYRELRNIVGDRDWIAENISRLQGNVGTRAGITGVTSPAAERPGDVEQELMSLGLGQLRNGDVQGAADVFRRVLSANPNHYGAHYQLAVALDRLGRTDEARALWQKVLTMAEGYRDQATIATARSRLSRRQ